MKPASSMSWAAAQPGCDAAAPVPVERFQQGPGAGRAQELLDVGEDADRARQGGRGDSRGLLRGRRPGRVRRRRGGGSPCLPGLAGAEPGPGRGAGLGGVRLVSDGGRPVRVPGGLVAGDGQQVTIGEPAGQRRGAQRGIDGGRPGQRGQLDRLGHLRPDPGRARGGGLGQPGPGAVADRQERFLSGR